MLKLSSLIIMPSKHADLSTLPRELLERIASYVRKHPNTRFRIVSPNGSSSSQKKRTKALAWLSKNSFAVPHLSPIMWTQFLYYYTRESEAWQHNLSNIILVTKYGHFCKTAKERTDSKASRCFSRLMLVRSTNIRFRS